MFDCNQSSQNKLWRTCASYFLSVILFLGAAILPVIAQSPSASTAIQETLLPSQLNDLVRRNKAIEQLQKDKDHFRKANDILRLSVTLSNLSLAYQQKGQWREAEDEINQAIIQLDKPQYYNSTNHIRLLASALLVKGQLKLAVGDPETALSTWQNAQSKFTQAGETIGETRSQLYQVLALQELGFHREALKTLLQVPELFQNSRDSQEKAIAYRSLGNLLRVIGFSEDVEEIEKKILPLKGKESKSVESEKGNIPKYLRQSRRLLEVSLDIATTEQDKTEALLGLGNTALAAYRHAQDAYDRVGADNDKKTAKSEFGEALDRYGEITKIQEENTKKQELTKINSIRAIQIQAQLNQYSLLIDYAKWLDSISPDQNDKFPLKTVVSKLSQIKSKILENLLQVYPSNSLVNARINFAKALLKQDENEQNSLNKKGKVILKDGDIEDFQQIKILLEEAYDLAEKLNDLRGESYSLGYLGKLYEQHQNKEDAYKYTKQALIKAEEIAEQGRNSKDLLYQWQWQLGRILKDRPKEAITAYEVAVKTLESLRGDLVSFNNPDLQFSFRDSVEPVYRQYVDLLLTDQEGASNLGRVSAAQEALQKAQKAIEDLQVAELENFLKCQLIGTRQVPIYKVIDDRQLNAATIYTIILEKRLEVILKLPKIDQFFRYTTSVNKESVEQAIKKLQDALQAGKSPTDKMDENYPTEFKAIYDWVLGKLMKDNKLEESGIKTLVFVLDSPLRNIPMAALYDGEQYLIEKYSIALNLGIEFSDRSPLQAGKFRMLAAGLSKPVAGYSGLDGVEVELKELESKFSGRLEKLQNEEFNSKKVQEQILQQNFDVIHLATHGVFSSDPESTSILLYDTKLDMNQMEQIFRKRTTDQLDTIGLLFLSACQTAVGDKRATLGIAGMAVRTGANSVIATLLDAPDAQAADLVVAFYDALGKPNVTKAEALRQAQLKILHNSSSNNFLNVTPQNWAPFVLIGNWQ